MNEIDLLSHVYQTAEMGQDGITSVLRYSRDPSLRQALERQKREYRELQASAGDMLRSRGVQPDGVGAAAKLSSELMSAMKTMVDHSSTKIAEMMIQGSTMGVTKSLRTLRDCRPEDPRVKDLADKLLKTEQANIEEMKTFL
ncbi:MAG TPA: hypothetical protein IAB33_00190 [Candidatus Pelethomonas intestinigallinarum]|nr:hypothetical protein [Candidatus Pelethomonas intestinigallinarum]